MVDIFGGIVAVELSVIRSSVSWFNSMFLHS